MDFVLMAECYIIHTIEYDNYFPTEAVKCINTLTEAYKYAFSQIKDKLNLNCCSTKFILTADNVAKIQLEQSDSDDDDDADPPLNEVKHLPINIDTVPEKDSDCEYDQFTNIQKHGHSVIVNAYADTDDWEPRYAPYTAVINKIEEGLNTIVLWTSYGEDGCYSTVCFLEVRKLTATRARLANATATAIIPIGEEQRKYANSAYRKLYNSNVFNNTYFSLAYRIKSAKVAGYKFIIVVGAEECSTNTVVIRTNTDGVIGTKTIDEAAKYFRSLRDSSSSSSSSSSGSDSDDA